MKRSVLFVFTSVNRALTGNQTGYCIAEAARPYYIIAPHANIDFASPKGPVITVDEQSVQTFRDEASLNFLKDEKVKTKFASAKKIKDVNPSEYDAVFYTGGHGPVIDLAADPVNKDLVSKFWNEGKIVSAVCHGVAALIQGVDEEGKLILTGKDLTASSDVEEQNAGKTKDVPWLVESKLREIGAIYHKGKDGESHVVVDGKLVTGQNTASSAGVADAVVKLLSQLN